MVQAVISKDPSHKSDNIQYCSQETSLKVAKVNLAEVPSEKKPVATTQKQTEIGSTRGMCDLDCFLFRILVKMLRIIM